ncbi:Mpo1-like protein [Paraburkholderia sp. EG287A]|uniref:Mpo1-like protein n=1 Tax=Paraburkholderia unamae TaxID=219649 RepID=A0ACC6RV09_9BURK
MQPTTHTEHFSSFAQFYPFYLSEHSNLMSRRLHFIGSLGVIGFVCMAIATGNWLWLPLAIVCGYGFAWFGHFKFEKNRPATFRHPIYSLMGDWVMFADICRGKISL